MDRIVRHVEEKGLVVAFRFVEGFQSLAGQSFGGEDAGPPVALQIGDGVERVGLALGGVTEIFLAEICGQATRAVASDIRLEAPVAGIFARGADGSEMCLAAVDGVIARFAQLIDEG